MIGNYEEYPEMLNRLFLEDKTKGLRWGDHPPTLNTTQ